ncbi:MAG: hypothetical protein HY302_14575 [Opitutae bacterium]|nr:hypothetical protein [Opitutae bacterium]
MSQATIAKRAKRTPAYGVGHGATPHLVPPSTLNEFLASQGITPARYRKIVKQYFGKSPETLKRTG